MGITNGGWSAHNEWDDGGWSRLDALTIIFSRINWILFIICFIVGVIVGFLTEKKIEETQQETSTQGVSDPQII